MEKTLRWVYKNKKLMLALHLISHIAGVLAFLVFCFVATRQALISPLSLIRLCVIIGTSYVVVSLARRIINAPRPYEIYDFYTQVPKNKKGSSFPSRHSFLIFAITTVAAPGAPIAAAILGFFGVLLAISRVLMGIHFIRDVLCGALLGVISSCLGLLILKPF